MEIRNYLKSEGSFFREDGRGYWVKLPKSKLHPVLKELRDKGLYRISSVTGVDTGKEIEVLYHIPHESMVINLVLSLPRERPEVETITKIYPGAVLYERELMEMLGVKVLNHPDPRPLFLSASSPKTPLRKPDESSS